VIVFRKSPVAGALVLGMLVSGCYSGGGPKHSVDGGGGPAMLAGAPAVSYTIPRVGGGTDSVASHRGSIVVMNFWATWCPPCQEEMPALETLYRSERARGLVVLGIDQGESVATAAAFAKAHGVTFPILVDADQQYASSYVSVGLPTTVIVGRNGHVAKGIDGAQTLGQFQALVGPLLAAK
jgi:cytochrome c biogenesis protein CcmG/thiol:disulfide interchange protein DsbE